MLCLFYIHADGSLAAETFSNRSSDTICDASSQIYSLMIDEQSYQTLLDTWDPACLYSKSDMVDIVVEHLKEMNITNPCSQNLDLNFTEDCDEVLEYWKQVAEEIPALSDRIAPDNSCDFGWAKRDFDQYFKSLIYFGGRPLSNVCANSKEQITFLPPREIPSDIPGTFSYSRSCSSDQITPLVLTSLGVSCFGFGFSLGVMLKSIR